MRVTIRDIAKNLNISHVTVSRVLNGRGNACVSEETRNRVIAAATEMDYRPNFSARALITGRTYNVAVWMPMLTTPFYAQALDRLERMITGDFYTMTLQRTTKPVAKLSDLVGTTAVDGTLMFDFVMFDGQSMKHNGRHRQPTVFVGSHRLTDADCVLVDLATGTREAIRHLQEQGCRRPAYVVSESMCYPDEARYEAYLATMAIAREAPLIIHLRDGNRAGARETLTAYLRDNDCPLGLFCQNDDIALGVFRALRDSGRRVPNDVLLVGCDGIDEAQYYDPSFSTVAQPLDEMCRLAWEFLSRRMNEPDAPAQQATLAAHLVVRGSSRRPG